MLRRQVWRERWRKLCHHHGDGRRRGRRWSARGCSWRRERRGGGRRRRRRCYRRRRGRHSRGPACCRPGGCACGHRLRRRRRRHARGCMCHRLPSGWGGIALRSLHSRCRSQAALPGRSSAHCQCGPQETNCPEQRTPMPHRDRLFEWLGAHYTPAWARGKIRTSIRVLPWPIARRMGLRSPFIGHTARLGVANRCVPTHLGTAERVARTATPLSLAGQGRGCCPGVDLLTSFRLESPGREGIACQNQVMYNMGKECYLIALPASAGHLGSRPLDRPWQERDSRTYKSACTSISRAIC